MFEDIDWETYFQVQINLLEPDLNMEIKFLSPLAGERKSDVISVMFDCIEKFDKVINFNVEQTADDLIKVHIDLGGMGLEALGDVLLMFNEVEDISLITVG